MICVDASVAVKWLFQEENADKADALLDAAVASGEPLIVPPLLPIEMTNVIYQRIRRSRPPLEDAERLFAQFVSFPVAIHNPAALERQALHMAPTYRLSATYDAHYLALAERLSATLWTDDARLLRELGGRLNFVRWMGDYPEP